MSPRSIRVLVVDDSAVIREIISDIVSEAPDMQVAGTANDGEHALSMLDRVNPDVITLDVQMPRMDGLAALDAILARRAIPVIMVSSLTKLGATITLDALDRGAIDYVPKPDYGKDARAGLRDDLLRKIRTAAGIDVRRILTIREERKRKLASRTRSAPPPKPTPETPTAQATALADKCIALGISTGGPPALSLLFESLRPPMPPIVVVQHMPPHFTRPLAWRLDSLSQLSIKEAETGDQLQPNHVFIAPGGRHLQLRPAGRSAKIWLDDGPPVSGHKPSVDVMMTSAARIFGRRCLGIIMTGMGRDGSDGCRAIRSAGGLVLGQDEASSDVYGMNKVAFVEGNVDRQFSLSGAAQLIAECIRRQWQPLPVGSA
ncbi:MAG: protein-glutamate methylesterase/protein-glutamine glutaminase [Planctomycetota bacterium]